MADLEQNLPTRQAHRITLLELLGLVSLVALIFLAIYRGDATVTAVHAVTGDLALDVLFDTCNADVSVDVEEHDDRVEIHPKNHDWEFPLTAQDDCQDLVRVALEQPLGDRVVTDSSGDEIAVELPFVP